MQDIPLALTYDDVLLQPRFSSVRSRRNVDCATCFTRQITLPAPLVSANMDSVTEARMAIAMAEFGGIGVIHRFLPVEQQVAEVGRVKRYQSEVIEDPYTIELSATTGQARRLMQQLGVSGLPVVAGDGKLLGMLTRRDLQFVEDSRPVTERMTPRERLVVARPGVDLDEARRLLAQARVEKLPLVDDQDRLHGMITAKDLSRDLGRSRTTRDEKGRLRVAAAVGVVDDFVERARALEAAGVDALVIDIAHGDSELMLSAIAQLRESVADLPLVARGNDKSHAGFTDLTG